MERMEPLDNLAIKQMFSGLAKALAEFKNTLIEVGRAIAATARRVLRFIRSLRPSLAREARGGNKLAKMLLASLGDAGLPAGLRYAPQIVSPRA